MPFEALTFIDASRRMPLLDLPIRTTVIELEGARLLFSPASTLSKAQLDGLGEITDIVCPSLLHAEGMAAAAASHPRARLWGPAGIREKVPALTWHGIVGSDPWPWATELPFVEIAGQPEMNEIVFLHARSKSLLVTDLVFNIERPSGAGAWIILHIFGTWRRFAVSRLFLRYVKDRGAFGQSMKRIAALDFDAVVPSHGEVVASGGKARLLAALRERGFEV